MEGKESHLLKGHIEDKNDNHILDLLKDSYKIKLCSNRNEPQSLNATETDLEVLINVVKLAHSSSNYALLKESFRCLRNCSIKNVNIQNKILSTDNHIIKISEEVLNEDKYPTVLKSMLLTLLINICIGNHENCNKVWKLFKFINLLKIDANKHILDKLCALAYNIFLYNDKLITDFEFTNEILNIIQENSNNDIVNEYAHFLIDMFIKNGQIFKFYDDIITVEFRINILQQLKEILHKKEQVAWSKERIEVLTLHFKKKSDCILKTVADYVDKIEPYEVALLADVIAFLCSDEKCLKMIQYDRSLLINCAFLLKSVHDAGKEGNNHFAPIAKLAKVENLKDDIQKHPAFGFRVNMIRILGNLAWKATCNQDEIRKLDLIPLLLDCCNIDGRNPFIIQWVVFAIRNICDCNIDNQKVIAMTSKKGLVDSGMLKELGITLHDSSDTINIAPLKLN